MKAKKYDTAYVNDQGINKDSNPDANLDPISGEPGAHPVGVGVGAAGGAYAGAIGGAYAGAAGGIVAGPAGIAAGAVIGAIAGGVVGGYAGKGVAELINPTEIDTYWSENFASRPYVEDDADYESYAPAYRYGYEARTKYQNKNFDEVESTLRSDWEKNRGNSTLEWNTAKEAARDSYDYTDTLYRRKLSDIK